MGRECSTSGETRNAYRMLVGKAEGTRPLGRPRCRWMDNIKIDLRDIGWDGRACYLHSVTAVLFTFSHCLKHHLTPCSIVYSLFSI
jgi:hypothetical protein